MDSAWVTIGYVRRPHGVRGYVKADSLSDAPDRFRSLRQVWLEFPDGLRERFRVEQCRYDGETVLIKFETVDTPEAAERLKSAYVQVPAEEAAPLPEGVFYVFALIGSRVVSETGDEIGTVRDVMAMPANDVLLVDTPNGEVLVPMIRDVVVAVEPARRRMVIRLMPGLIV
jgi:16S rRNA processing protein RimM